jgi:hypothetical protein
MPSTDGDSSERRLAESVVLELVGARLSVTLTPQRLYLLGGASVDVDGVSPDESVLVEVFAHQGAFKGS